MRCTEQGVDDGGGSFPCLIGRGVFLRAFQAFECIFLRDERADAAHCLLDRQKLVQNFPAAAVLLNHALNPADLTFDASQALERVLARIRRLVGCARFDGGT